MFTAMLFAVPAMNVIVDAICPVKSVCVSPVAITGVKVEHHTGDTVSSVTMQRIVVRFAQRLQLRLRSIWIAVASCLPNRPVMSRPCNF